MNRFAYLANAKNNQQMFQFVGKGEDLRNILKCLLAKEKAAAGQSKTA